MGMLDESDQEGLELIGFTYQTGIDSKAIILLQSMLKAQVEKGRSLSFSDVYDAFSIEDEGKKTSRAWIHRLLKSLIDQHLVAIEDVSARRNNYVCDINTLSAGLSFLRDKAVQTVHEQSRELEERERKLKNLDTTSLAENLHESMTGRKKHPTSRFLKGLDEFHRVTDETIYKPSKLGDIIRNSVANVGPFVPGYAERTIRLFTMAAKGVEVRYSVAPDSLKEEGIFGADMNVEFMQHALKMLRGPGEEGQPGLHARINPAAPKSHQFASLNNEIMALWISEYPPTAAWITRDFNADLIDDIIKTFDEQWEKSIHINKALDELLKKHGIQQSKKGAET